MNRVYRHSQRRKLISEINVVPYIDVTLVLLIIFMITAPLQQTAVFVNLPTSGGAKLDLKQQLPLIIAIPQDGQYYLTEKDASEQPVSLSELLSRVATLHKTNPQISVYIKADKAVAYGEIILVMAALKEAGVPQVGLMTSPIEP